MKILEFPSRANLEAEETGDGWWHTWGMGGGTRRLVCG